MRPFLLYSFVFTALVSCAAAGTTQTGTSLVLEPRGSRRNGAGCNRSVSRGRQVCAFYVTDTKH